MRGAALEPAVHQLGVTGILPEKGRKDRPGHEAPDCGVRKSDAISLSIPGSSLAELRLAVLCLADDGDEPDEWINSWIECVLRDQLEFSCAQERRNLVLIFNRQVVWENKEEAIVRGAGPFRLVFVLAVFAWFSLLRLLLRGRRLLCRRLILLRNRGKSYQWDGDYNCAEMD